MSTNELIAIELQLKGREGVLNDIRTLDSMLNGLNGRKNKVTIESNLAEAKKDIIAYKAEVAKLKQELAGVSKGHREGNKWIRNPEWSDLNRKLKEAERNLSNARQRAQEFEYALRNLTQMSWGQAFNKISSGVAHLGSAFQSAGNALTRLTSPFKRFTTGLVMGAGYKALNLFTEGLSNSFTRADTMNKYTKLMAEYETANYTAKKSREELDESVQGLPIALDDAISLAQRYTLSLGDMERGTQLAIATNNAFLASMATEQQRYQGMLQLQDLMNGKTLTGKEWMSLGSSMGKAINEIGIQLGYGKDQMGEFRQQLYAGKVDTQEFLNALIEVGTGEGSLVALAKTSAETWEGLFSNMRIAATRLGADVLESVNDAVKKSSGRTLLQQLLGIDKDGNEVGDGIKHFVNGISKSIQDWIKANPDEITNFLDAFKGVDWRGLLGGFAQGMLEVAHAFEWFASAMKGKDLSWIGKWMTRGNILGNALTILGGLMKGSRHLWGGIGATLFKGIQASANIKKYGLTGWLGGLVLGEKPEKALETMDTVAKASPKMGKFSSGLSSIFKGWGELAVMVGGTALVGWGSLKLIKDSIKTIGDIGEEVKKVDWSSAASALKGFGIFMGSFMTLGSILGAGGATTMTPAAIGTAVLGGLTALTLGFADLDMRLVKDTLKQLSEAVGYLNPIIDEVSKVKDVGSGAKDKISNAIKAFNEITKLFKGDFDEGSKQWQNGLLHFDKDFADSLHSLRDSLDDISSSIDIVNKLNGTKLESSNIESLMSTLQASMSFIGNMAEHLPDSMKSGKSVGWMENMSNMLTNLQTAMTSLIGKGGFLGQIPKFIDKMTNLVNDGSLTEFEANMESLGSTITNAYKNLSGKLTGSGDMLQRVQNFADAMLQARRVIYHLGKINTETEGTNIDGAVSSISSTIGKLKTAFSGDKVGELKASIETFTTSIKDALKTISDIGNDPIEIDAKVKLTSGFNSSVNDVKSKIRSAKDSIKKLATPVSITIPINVWFRVNIHKDNVGDIINDAGNTVLDDVQDAYSSTTGGATGGMFTRSGVLYRSHGGGIGRMGAKMPLFKPRGVDTVPAMLQVGEYVQKKQAVDFFGTDFMRSINNMDVRGAMNALLTKAGTTVGMGRQSIVNNTVNNNQRITQNINTNNPNFAGARMGRFVGAL